MGDLWSVNLLDFIVSFRKVQLNPKGLSEEGLTLCRHKAVLFDEKTAFIFGGKRADQASVNWLLKIDLGDSFKVTKLSGGNLLELPCLESHEMQAIGKMIYIFGGFETSFLYGCYGQMIKVDPTTSTFKILQVKGNPPQPRMNAASCLDSNNRILLLGGAGDKVKFNDLRRFDTQTETWTLLSNNIGIPGLEGHQMILHPHTNKLVVFGGIHEISDENRRFFSLDSKGHVIDIEESTNGGPLVTRDQFQIQRRLTRSMSKTSEQSKRFNVTKGRSRKFFMKTDLELKFYQGEFVVADEKVKANYRVTDKNTAAMKDFLGLLGMFNNHQGYCHMIEDDNVLKMTEVKPMEDDSEFEAFKQEHLKESRRPLPLEGHTMLFAKDRLIIVGGMRHTLPFNEISFIMDRNLGLTPSSPNTISQPEKRLNMLPFLKD